MKFRLSIHANPQNTTTHWLRYGIVIERIGRVWVLGVWDLVPIGSATHLICNLEINYDMNVQLDPNYVKWLINT